jgi:hypothetical protein
MASSLLQAAGFSEHDASIHQEHCNIAMQQVCNQEKLHSVPHKDLP